MRRALIIRLDDKEPTGCEWLSLEAGSATIPRQGNLDEAARVASEHRETQVLVPTSHCMLTRVRIPSRQRQQIIQAVPYALEERLIDDVEALHFAIGRPDGEGQIPVAITSRKQMDDWLERLQEADIEPSLMTPDVLCLPAPPEGHWTVCLSGGEALLRTGHQTGFVCDLSNLVFCLEQCPATERPEGIVHHRCTDNASYVMPALPLPVEVVDHDMPMLALMAAELRTDVPLNLLQGSYSRNRQIEQFWHLSRPTLALIGLLFVAFLVGDLARMFTLERERDRLEQAATSLYRQIFPDDKRLVDLRIQAERHLATLRQAQGMDTAPSLFDLLSKAGPVLSSTLGLTIERLTFHNEILSLRLSLPSLAAVETLKNQLAAATKHDVKILSATADQGHVTTSIEIRSREVPSS